MTDNLKRINLYMDTEILEVLDEFASITGQSRSTIIRSFLRPAVPSLESLLVAAREAKTEKDKVDARLTTIERSLLNTLSKLPDAIEGKKIRSE